MPAFDATTLTPIVGVAVVAVVAFRAFRQREFRVGRLWILPLATLLCLPVALYDRLETGPTGFAVMVAAMVLGTAIGWMRGSLMILRIDLPRRRIVTKGGAWMLLLIIAVMAVQLLLKNVLSYPLHRLADAGMMLAIGSISAQRLRFFHAYLLAAEAAPAANPDAVTEKTP